MDETSGPGPLGQGALPTAVPGGGVTCRYPGCRRPPAVRAGDRGREPEFCGQRDPGGPIHSRQAARVEEARRAQAGQAVLRRAGIVADSPTRAEQEVPVDYARAELGVLLEQLQVQAAGHTATWQQILARLDTASDPAAMTAQLRAGTTAAQAEVAAAQA
ncbi:MAG: hypothetical protein WAL50_20560, partial [Kineosporiaceae bacterium]